MISLLNTLAHVTPAEWPAALAMFLGGVAAGVALSAGVYRLYIRRRL